MSKAGERRVNRVEQAVLIAVLLARDRRLGHPVGRRQRPRQRQQLRHALAFVHAARLGADLRVGLAKQRVVGRKTDRQRVGRLLGIRVGGTAEAGHEIELLRLPRTQPLANLLGVPRRVAGQGEGFARQSRRGLVMLAAADAGRAEPGHDVGTNRADHADEVAEHLVVPPLLERLLDAEREAEIDGAREVLLGRIEAMQRRQFLRPQHAERLEDLGADLVLAAVAARRRDERRPVALAAVEHHQQPVVLVVGMRRRHHEDAGVAEMTQ